MTTCTGSGQSYYELSAEQLAKVPEEIRDFDWFEAFGYAPFAITDVSKVVAVADGERDVDNWVGVFRLKDKRYGYVVAGCDCTGWGCQANGTGAIRKTLQEIIVECCTDDDRRRLKLKLSK